MQKSNRFSRRLVTGLVAALAALAVAAPVASAGWLPSYGGASGYAVITGADNSGWSRHLTMYQYICKDSTVLGRKIEYRMNFGPNVSTDWKGGVSRGLNSGCSDGYRTDTFYYPNSARGVWVRVCIDDPGPYNRCGSAAYLSL